MAERTDNKKRTDNKGRKLRTGEYYNSNTHIYQFRKMINGKRVTISDTDLAILRKRENELLVAIDKGKNVWDRKKCYSLDEYFDFWVNTYAIGKRKATTITNYRAYYSTYIRGNLGKKRLDKITKVDCQIVFNKMMNDGKSTSTMANLKSCLSKVFSCALDDDLIIKDPVKNIDIPKAKKQERKTVSDQDTERFMEFVNGSQAYSYLYPLFVVLFNTGMRIGELIALTWDDIDFKTNTIQINKSLNRYRKADHGFTIGISTPKSDTSTRMISFNDTVRKTLLEHRIRSEKHTNYSIPYVNESGKITGQCSGFVFLNSQGRIYTEPLIRDTVQRIVDKYNSTADPDKQITYFCPHQVRHTFTTLAYESGADPKVVSEMLGHKSTNVTMDVYTHIRDTKEKQKQVISAVNVG